jgi:hypothetical protein
MSFADAGDACLDPDLKTDQVSSSIKNTLKCVSKKNPGANQAHQCCNRLDHRKHPLRTPRKQNDVAPRTVKRISEDKIGIGVDRGFRATGCAKSEQQQPLCRTRVPSVNTPRRRQPSVHHRKALPISAVFRMRYLGNLVRRVGRTETRCRSAST